MFRIAFWNIQGKDQHSGIVDRVAGLIGDTRPDILGLAECHSAVATKLLRTVNRRNEAPAYSVVEGTSRVRVFYRGPVSPLKVVPQNKYSHARYHLLRLDRPAVPLLIACVHMVSLLEKTPLHIDAQLRYLSHEISCAEQELGHANTIVFGDLNAHPFSEGVAAAGGLHGIMSRRVVATESRQVGFHVQPMMFNPLWQFYRGEGDTPQGTFYRVGKGDELVYFWNLFDQFLFRPSLLPYYRDGQTEIVTRIQDKSLLNKVGVPDGRISSDHLPILLTLDC